MNTFFKTIGLLITILLGIISVTFTDAAGSQVYINFGSYFVGSFSIFHALLAAPLFYLFTSLGFLKRYAVGHSYVQLFKI